LKGLRPLILANEIVRGGGVTLKAGEAIRDFNIEMAATGTLSGRVTGPNGSPMPEVAVRALRRTYQDGRLRLSDLPSIVSRGAATNDRGEYRAFSLPPAEYFLQFFSRTSDANVKSVYFPGTADREGQ
jgi:protocatechuate 3,4-dioxygenase beta subunit